jgi:hypothetical protein
MRDVENASTRIAERHGNDEFVIAPSRLSDFETKGVVPSIYRVYALAVIYRRDMRELLSWYGVDLNSATSDLDFAIPPRSHVSEALANLSTVEVPVRLDPSFDARGTVNFGRMVEQWGQVTMAYLAQFAT